VGPVEDAGHHAALDEDVLRMEVAVADRERTARRMAGTQPIEQGREAVQPRARDAAGEWVEIAVGSPRSAVRARARRGVERCTGERAKSVGPSRRRSA